MDKDAEKVRHSSIVLFERKTEKAKTSFALMCGFET